MSLTVAIVLRRMSTIFVLSSGVGARPGGRFDYIGELAEQLKALGVDVAHNYMLDDRLRMKRRVQSYAKRIAAYENVRMAGHSRGVRFLCDVARKSGKPIRALYSADGWSPGGVLNIPANIQHLAAWYQHEDRPMGSRIHLEGDTLFNDLGPVSGVIHRDMAKYPAFVKAVLRSAKGN
jgi:hypothetical protein